MKEHALAAKCAKALTMHAPSLQKARVKGMHDLAACKRTHQDKKLTYFGGDVWQTVTFICSTLSTLHTGCK